MRLFLGLTVLLSLVLSYVHADLYISMPRGSNNRLDEANRDRENGNRLFDSQNNNRGGYNVGQIYYYTGSTVTMDWTAQHGCGDTTRNTCEFIIQYTCDDLIRDGTQTKTIPTNPNECSNWDCDKDVRFGRHESFDDYQSCVQTSRNRGLWTASQNLQGRSRRFTRQNPGGARNGYECPEERDYYPYWLPTRWVDLAILTNDPSRCDAYRSESQNVKERFYCKISANFSKAMAKQNRDGFIPITRSECEALSWFDPAANQTTYGVWTRVAPFGLPAPTCRENQYQRDNHHGNARPGLGFPATFNFTIPDWIVHERCVLRIRYNISTGDINNWDNSTSIQVSALQDYTRNSNKTKPTANRDPAWMPELWTKYGFTNAEVADSFKGLAAEDSNGLKNTREYVMKNNPRVDIFGPLLGTGFQSFIKTQLAINTAQYGRVFQDRTHRFAIRKRPSDIPSDATIHNLQVKGKRGNIVQTYPGTEYDFVPYRLEMQSGDYLHIQWTGSNTNPNNNAGQGKEGTDRHNMVPLRPRTYQATEMTNPTTYGNFAAYYPARIDTGIPFLGLNQQDLTMLAILNKMQFGGNMKELDDAGTYFDLGPRKITQLGIYHYLCTRNNNFSNRNQAGKIKVSAASATTDAIGRTGGRVSAAGGQSISFAPQALTSLQLVSIEAQPRSAMSASVSGSVASDFLAVAFENTSLADGQAGYITLNYDNKPLHLFKAYYSEDGNSWSQVDASFSGGTATVRADKPGTYVASSELNAGAVAGIVIGCVVFIAIILGVTFVVWKRRKESAATPSTTEIPTIKSQA